MINEIKTIVDNYMNNRMPCRLMLGTVVSGGVQVSDRLTIPDELIAGNLKNSVTAGNRVRLLRDDGGQLYYLLEVISS